MKYYVIAELPGEDNKIHPVEEHQDAKVLVGSIGKQIAELFNPSHLTMTYKEDDLTIKWNGNLIAKLMIRREDEVDISFLNEQ